MGTPRSVALLGLVVGLGLSGCAFVERVDVRTDGTSPSANEPAGYLSGDGRYDAFTAFTPLDPSDGNNAGDAYVRDVATNTTERVSLSTSGGDPDALAAAVGISASGRYVLIDSTATNLVAGGTTGENLFLRDRTAGTTTLVTATTDGKELDSPFGRPNLSADGHHVVFDTAATNVAPGAGTNRSDVYVRDVVAGTTSRVNVNSNAVVANNDSQAGGISGDGNVVVFETTATNMPGAAPNTSFNRVYVRDRSAGTTTYVSAPLSGTVNGGALPADHAITTDGRFVLFVSWADNLTADDPVGTTDVYLRDLTTGTTSLVMAPNGIPSGGDNPPLVPLPAVGLSDDGRFVVVNGLRTGDATHLSDIQAYVIDRAEGRVVLVRSPRLQAFTQPARASSISADGRYVAFTTGDPLSVGSFVRSSVTPTIASVSPAAVTRGTHVDVQVTGDYLFPGATFDFGHGVTVGTTTIVDEHHATVSIDVANDAPLETRTPVVTDPGSGAGPGTGGTGLGFNLFTITGATG